MRNKILFVANFKRHKGTLFGIFIIMIIACLTFISALSIWLNTNTYLQEEMNRMQYGDITAWTQGIENPKQLQNEIEQLDEVDTVSIQQLIYSDYKIHDMESDHEGQLLVYEPQAFPYRIFNEDNTGYQSDVESLGNKEIYISPSLLSTFDVAIGDEITFTIGRQGMISTFKVKGTFEDPFMGSSMIGMKSFLISEADFKNVSLMIESAGIDGLARSGEMFHITQSEQSLLSNAQFNQLINERSSLIQITEFVHSKEAITGFMLILQNAFTALFLAFALILLLVSVIIISYSISSSIEQDRKDMAILKSVGYDGKQLRNNVKIQYLMVIMLGMLIGIILSFLSIPVIGHVMVNFAGILTPATPHFMLWIIFLLITFILFYGFLHFKTRRVNVIPPVAMIKDEGNDVYHPKKRFLSLKKHGLRIRLSINQLISAKRRYIGVCVTAILLVFFTSMIGRMNIWLGPEGEGMMDAFNPADLDIGVQLLGDHNIEDMEQMIQQSSKISDQYALAMLSVAVDGVDYTVNVITEPKRFSIRQGSTSQEADEIVITDTIAKDRNLSINDTVIVTYHGQSATYKISGIYQCANDMGENIGMNREGFQRIGEETPDMWCHHFFLEDQDQKQSIIDTLNEAYGGDVYIHENTWPGLFSIISAMQALIMMMYVITGFFIMIVTILTVNKIFLFEKRNLSIYKALGFTTNQLRTTFAIRYGIVAVIGSVIGIMMSVLLCDPLVGNLMKLYGIANFVSHPEFLSILLPGIIVSVLFIVFAYISSRKLKNLEMNELIVE